MEQPTEQHPDHPEDGSPHPILGFVDDLSAGLDAIESVDPMYLSADQLRAAVLQMTRQGHRYEAHRLRLLAVADAQRVGDHDGSPSTGAWLSQHTRTDPAEAHAQVRLARQLEQQRPATRAALAAGDITPAQAQVVVTAIDRLPRKVPVETRTTGEQALLLQARHHPPKTLRILGRRLLEVIAPDLADAHLGRQVHADEAAAWAKTRLTLHDQGDGTTRGWFVLPTLNARMLAVALEALTAPRKHKPRKENQSATSSPDSADQTGPEVTVTVSAADVSVNDLHPDAPTRRGQGFAQLLEHLPVDKLGDHGSTTATVVVTMTLADLAEKPTDAGALGLSGMAGLDDDTPISAATARKLACEAGIIPMVLGGPSVIGDRGRTQRLFNHQQRLSLTLRDRHCRAKGCETPAAWTEAHHLTPWSQGGRTDLTDGILLCGHHHRLIHSPDYHHKHQPASNTVTFQRRSPART